MFMNNKTGSFISLTLFEGFAAGKKIVDNEVQRYTPQPQSQRTRSLEKILRRISNEDFTHSTSSYNFANSHQSRQ